jgi:hypothetical protein
MRMVLRAMDQVSGSALAGSAVLMIHRMISAAVPLHTSDEKLVLSPAYPEIPPSFWEQYGLWVVLGSVISLGIIAAVLILILLPKPAVPVPIEVQTRNELESLLNQPEDGRTLSRISRCLRRYVAGAFGLPPEELTTAELNQLVTQNAMIGPELAPALITFFKRCDEVKFSPDVGQDTGHAQRALELFEEGERRRMLLRQAAAEQPPVVHS